MQLKLNSLNARLYRWVYATSRMPESLCPYFWKLFLMWIVLIPYTILSLPYMGMNMERRHDGELERGSDFFEKPVTGFFVYAAIYLALVMLFSISVFWLSFPKDSFGQNMQFLGIALWFIAIVIGAYHLFKYIRKRIEDSKIKYDENGHRIWTKPEPEQDSILVSFIKAKYNKYCPRIDWK